MDKITIIGPDNEFNLYWDKKVSTCLSCGFPLATGWTVSGIMIPMDPNEGMIHNPACVIYSPPKVSDLHSDKSIEVMNNSDQGESEEGDRAGSQAVQPKQSLDRKRNKERKAESSRDH